MTTPQDYTQSVLDFVDSILAAVTNPADAVQVFSQLANFPVDTSITNSAIGDAQTALDRGIADFSRRTVVGALAQAASFYQPTSYDDAASLRTFVCNLIDNEITIAGDQGEDASYQALVSLRAAVVQDLTARGATLAPLITVQNKAPMPSLAMAYRLYQDITRVDQLVAFADPRHPGFMPTEFKALAR